MSEAAQAVALIDSHCHLQSLDEEVREAALERARARGVSGFLVPATRLEEADVLLSLCDRHPDVWCALGVHPHEARRWQQGDAERLAELARHRKVVAIGECGLDFHYDFAPRSTQERALREQWEVALELGLPVVVHERESASLLLEIVDRPEFAPLRADFHSFSAGAGVARRLTSRGLSWFGVSGMVTFKKADNVREPLPAIPGDRLLVETDTPYLAPVPYRGKPNEPAYVVEVAQRLGEVLGWSLPEVAERTTRTFFELFPRTAS